jgi:hypothetical protein
MKTTYKTDYQSNLFMYMEVESAADYKKISDKMYTHSEYQTGWDDKLGEWRQKEYWKDYNIELLEGEVKIMFIIQFVGGSYKTKEFIPELYKYFNIDGSSYDEFTCIYYTKFTPIKDLELSL